MARLLWFLSMALSAVVLGTATAIWATQTLKPTGMVTIGPWEAVRAVGDAAADPYAHAFIASSGQLPPGSAEGMRFVAQATHDGRALIPNCSITVSGRIDIARLWTLSLAAGNGDRLDVAPPQRTGLHSQDIVYRADGSFELTIGPRTHGLNTLTLRSSQPLSLILHVYDGALSGVPESGVDALPFLSVDPTMPGCGG